MEVVSFYTSQQLHTVTQLLIEISDSLWYTFVTVTTIGFGDFIAGTGFNDYCIDNGSDHDVSHQTNAIFWVNIHVQKSLKPIEASQLFQVSKMIFLLIALSFMTAAWLLKYDMIVENRLTQFSDGKQLIETGGKGSFEDSEMNNALEN